MYKRIVWILFYGSTAFAVLLISCFASQTATVLAENQPIARKHCIIVDAGHGGVDGGATSCTGRLESAYNLDIALRLQDLLHLMGFDTKMIRTTDISVYTKDGSIAQKKVSDLKERVRIVNETENSILLSIHQNNFSDSRYRGAQVFFSEAERSKLLAKQMQQAFTVLDPQNRRVSKKSQGIYLMDHIDRTGILIECGFLSNPGEEALLSSKAYQQKLCCVIAATTSSFLSNT